ncbi:acetylcholinesterase-like [Dermacentor andersoni]|uniref:acetylcholinesterase-like n=1 Tax=Dermacentor andersoni TaxID=34620 RepID=UPI0021559CA7|nr:acetylcholinesterase-like [Dermacentor andersoni]
MPSGARPSQDRRTVDDERPVDESPEFSILAIRTLFAVVWIATTAVVTFTTEKDHSAPVSYPHCGPLQGVDEIFEERRLHVYYGVPFMRPALLHNRFERLPILERPWPFLLDARNQRSSCPQPSINVGKMTLYNTNTTEDCLYLNIYLPARKLSESMPKYPIIVFIYGGSYYSGGNSFPFYSGKYLAAHGNAMVVVPNYRLGVFGFLRSSILGLKGNQGLHDVYAALLWVKSNAAAFGGEVHSVTVMGHQVGAAMIGLLNSFSGASELFHRVVMMSGSPYMRHWKEDGKAKAREQDQLMQKLGCRVDPKALLDCLRGKTAKSVLDFATKLKNWKTMFLPSEYEDIRDDASVDLKSTAVSKDLIIGTTVNEGSYYANLFLEMFSKYDASKLTRIEAIRYLENVTASLGLHGYNDLVYYYDQKYKDHSADIFFANAIGDIVVNCPMKQFAQDMTSVNTKVFMYVFKHKPSYSTSRLEGAAHLDDIFISFGQALDAPALNVSEVEKELSREMLRMWARFAENGDPVSLRNVTWPQFTKGEGVYLNIGPEPTLASRYLEGECDKVARALFN